MTKQGTKSGFIGIKVTSEQSKTLSQLQQTLNSPTKTEVLLQGLDLLAKSDLPPALTTSRKQPQAEPQIATSFEISRFEAEARRYFNTLQQTKYRSEEVMKQNGRGDCSGRQDY